MTVEHWKRYLESDNLLFYRIFINGQIGTKKIKLNKKISKRFESECNF